MRLTGKTLRYDKGSTVSFLHGDHLGSASLTTNNAGTKIAEARYMPYGEMRYQWSNTPTDKRFTLQRFEGALGGVYDFNARYLNPLTGRFLSADSIVPDGDTASLIPLTVDFHEPQFLMGVAAENTLLLLQGWAGKDVKPRRGPMNPQQLNRFSYALGNPLRFTDPTGHDLDCNDQQDECQGVEVINKSSEVIYVKGKRINKTNRTVDIVVGALTKGMSSRDLGIIDVDAVIVTAKPNGELDTDAQELRLYPTISPLQITDTHLKDARGESKVAITSIIATGWSKSNAIEYELIRDNSNSADISGIRTVTLGDQLIFYGWFGFTPLSPHRLRSYCLGQSFDDAPRGTC
jgi:RHS repeat-associated protein